MRLPSHLKDVLGAKFEALQKKVADFNQAHNVKLLANEPAASPSKPVPASRTQAEPRFTHPEAPVDITAEFTPSVTLLQNEIDQRESRR